MVNNLFFIVNKFYVGRKAITYPISIQTFDLKKTNIVQFSMDLYKCP